MAYKLKPYQPKPRYIPKNKKREEAVQVKVANYLKRNYPNVIFSSDAAGLFMTINQAKRWKAQNSERGRPDMTIYFPSRGYHGLCMELKREGVNVYVTRGPRKGELSANEQIRIEAAVLQELNSLGYCARFAIGYDKAIKLIDWYFKKPENEKLF